MTFLRFIGALVEKTFVPSKMPIIFSTTAGSKSKAALLRTNSVVACVCISSAWSAKTVVFGLATKSLCASSIAFKPS